MNLVIDLDLKTLISVLISIVSLTISIINWQTNIKIKNQMILVKITENNTLILVQIKSKISDAISKLRKIQLGTSKLDDKAIVDIVFDGVKDISTHELLLEDWGLLGDIEIHVKPLESMGTVKDKDLDIITEVLNVKILRIVSKLCIGIGDTKFDQLMTLFSIDNGFYLGKTQRL